MKLILNPSYILKPDDGRALLMSKEYYRTNEGGESDFSGFIHPIHAMILGFFDGGTNDSIDMVASYLRVSKESILKFITPLIENNAHISIKYQNILFVFPEKTLCYSNTERKTKYNPDEFLYDKLDLRLKRHKTPTDVTFMVTNKCATDCLYCYADRRNEIDCKVSIERLEEIINEAKRLRLRTFSLIGGEFLLYKHWRRLLEKLLDSGFSPYLSTKIPMGEKIIRDLKEIGIIDIQVSLDTLVEENLRYILKVNSTSNYFEQIKKTIFLLNEYDIKTVVHTIITSFNQNIGDIVSVYNYIKDFKSIEKWRLDPVGASMYKNRESYHLIKADDEKLREVYYFLDKIKQEKEHHFEISIDGIFKDNIADNPQHVLSFEEKKTKFFGRAFCTGSFSQMFILPDGKVTICEELYWHPQFILGDINNQSLEEIWNSNKALEIYNFPQSKISKESPCNKCKDYNICRVPKQICWKNTVKAYGDDKWYYPDVNCPKAPEKLYSIK